MIIKNYSSSGSEKHRQEWQKHSNKSQATKIYKGIVVTKKGCLEELKNFTIIESGHPVPDTNSVKAGDSIIELLKDRSKDDLIINLISGGASSLLCAPLSIENGISLTLEDKQSVNKLLLNCGADIHEINTIRKHLSKLKGGRLSELIYPAESLNIILSDVVGDEMDVIGSGPTSPDPTTFNDVLKIIQKYNLLYKIPENALNVIKLGVEGKIPETPKPDSKIFKSVKNILIGTNHHALIAAKAEAEKLGFNALILTSSLTGESKEAGNFFASIGYDAYKHKTFGKLPVCIISGGETTVTIKGKGLGGRNMEMALSFLANIGKSEEISKHLFFFHQEPTAATDRQMRQAHLQI